MQGDGPRASIAPRDVRQTGRQPPPLLRRVVTPDLIVDDLPHRLSIDVDETDLHDLPHFVLADRRCRRVVVAGHLDLLVTREIELARRMDPEVFRIDEAEA